MLQIQRMRISSQILSISIEIANNKSNASISLTWKLTYDQQPIYAIYKSWPTAIRKSGYYLDQTFAFTENMWDSTASINNWDKAKIDKYKSLNLNGPTLNPQIQEDIALIWAHSKTEGIKISKYLEITLIKIF